MNQIAQSPTSTHTLFRGQKYKGPFIADQRMRRLVLPTDGSVQAMECFDPVKFRAARRKVEEEGKTGEVELPEGCHWQAIESPEDRVALLANGDAHPRMLITIEAGTGKTIAIQQIMYLRNCYAQMFENISAEASLQNGSEDRLPNPPRPKHLAIGAKFVDLPEDPKRYLHIRGGRDPWLVEQLANNNKLADAEPNTLLQLVRRKLSLGQLTLVVDAFDQTGSRDVTSRVQALADFINQYPEIQLVCAGRPNSILEYKQPLFGDGHWSVIQVAEFDQPQIIRYIGQDRFDAIKKTMDVEIQSQPRMLESIRRLSATSLRGLRTGSALQWKVISKTVAQSLEDQSRPPRLSSLWRLISAIAFQMTDERNFDGVSEDDFEEFAERLMEQRPAIGQKYTNDFEQLEKDIFEIGRLNELLDFAVLEAGKRLHVYFRNRTLQAFFAAMWVTRFSSTVEERAWLQSNPYLRGAYADHFQNGDLYEFWKFATEMPGGNAARNDNVYAATVASLFVPLTDDQPDSCLVGAKLQRSTEMIWRSWWPLLELAIGERFANEEQMFAATNQLQKEVRQEFAKGHISLNHKSTIESIGSCVNSTDKSAGADLAKRILQQYLAEFLSLAHGKAGDSKQQQLAATFDRHVDKDFGPERNDHGFVVVPKGEFYFGLKGDTKTQPEDFWLSRFPVTNESIRLFDPSHGKKSKDKKSEPERFDDYSDYSKLLQCPAIYCDWYTAWSFATWALGMLPDEFQWESASRGTMRPPRYEATKFGFEGGDDELAEYAWFIENSKHVAHEMGGSQETKRANGFGLFHMHGSVWEWTSSWVERDLWIDGTPSRCLRGGSFNSNASVCRCAFRFRNHPFNAYRSYGFRIARAK